MSLKIYQDGDLILRRIAAPITDFTDIPALADQMLGCMKEASGIGLAAPQIGTSLRLIVASLNGLTLRMANPEIVIARGSQRQPDGCLSVDPKYWGRMVTRAAEIHVKYQDVDTGEWRKTRLRKGMAFCVQHEIDHLNGILFTDYLDGKQPAPVGILLNPAGGGMPIEARMQPFTAAERGNG